MQIHYHSYMIYSNCIINECLWHLQAVQAVAVDFYGQLFLALH